MKAIYLSLFLLFGLSLCNNKTVKIEEPTYEKEGNIYLLDNSNFDEFTKSRFSFVFFYHHNTPQILNEQFESAANTLKEKNENITLCKVNYDTEKKILKKYNIMSSNSFYLFRKGFVQEYRGTQSSYNFIEYCLEKIKHRLIKMPFQNFNQTILDNKGVFVIYFGNNKIKASIVERVSYQIEEYPFYHLSDVLTIGQNKRKLGQVAIYKNFDEKINIFEGKLNEENLIKFIEKYSKPLVQTMSKEILYKIYQRKIPYAFYFQDDYNETEELKFLREIAKENRGKINFVVSKLEGSNGESEISKQFKVKNDSFLGIVDGREKMKRYILEEKITKESTEKFINNFLDGKLKPVYISQDLPENSNENVLTLVGNNFKKEVLENNKDVLVNFYSPNCPHCNQLSPIYEELAKKLKQNKDLVIAKFDAVNNGYEGIDIRAFPTIYLYRAGKKENPIEYKNKIEIEKFISFLKEECTHPIKEKAQEDL